MRGILAAAVVAAGLAVIPGAAHAVKLESADRKVDTVRVTYVEPVGRGRMFLELNNGAAYRLNACRYEDGRHCFWSAGSAGNGRGDSFVVVDGRVIYTRRL